MKLKWCSPWFSDSERRPHIVYNLIWTNSGHLTWIMLGTWKNNIQTAMIQTWNTWLNHLSSNEMLGWATLIFLVSQFSRTLVVSYFHMCYLCYSTWLCKKKEWLWNILFVAAGRINLRLGYMIITSDVIAEIWKFHKLGGTYSNYNNYSKTCFWRYIIYKGSIFQ